MRRPHLAVPFLDRSGPRAVIRDHLSARRGQGETALVFVHAQAGLGSYSLAAEVCDEHLRTFDGYDYIEVQAAEADGSPVPLPEVLGQALRGLGAAEPDLAVSDRLRLQHYQRLSAGRRFLLLVRDAVLAEQVEGLIPSSAPESALLVTGRRALRELYAKDFLPVPLEKLPRADAHALLVRSLGATADEIDPGLVAELDELCDGHPLLIRLVAAHLLGRARAVQPLVARARRSLAALLELAATAPVAAKIKFAYDGLKKPLQEAYRRVALIPGPDFAVAAAAIACGTDELTAAEMLDELVDANLLTFDDTSGRYRFHAVFRADARVRAREDDGSARCDEIVGRVTRWYLDECVPRDAALSDRWRVGEIFPAFAASGRPRPDRGQAIAWFETEWRNVVGCVADAADVEAHDVAWQLCIAVFKFLHMHGHTVAWLESHRIGIASAERTGDQAGIMQLTNQRGAAWIALGRLPEARADFETSLTAARRAGHVLGEQSNLEWLGKVASREGEFGRAFEYYDASAKVIDTAGAAIPPHQAQRMRALLDLQRARAHLALGEQPNAVAAAVRAMGYFTAEAGERENRAKCLQVLGDALDDRQAAAEAHREAAELFGADGLRRAEAGSWLRAGRLRQDPGGRRAALERARDLYAGLGDPKEDEAGEALDE